MASSKLRLWMLLLGLTDGASGGAPGAWPAPTTKHKPLDPSLLRVSPLKFAGTCPGDHINNRNASVLDRNGVASDASPTLDWRMLVNPAAEEPHRQLTPPNCLGVAGRGGSSHGAAAMSCRTRILPSEGCFGTTFSLQFDRRRWPVLRPRHYDAGAVSCAEPGRHG